MSRWKCNACGGTYNDTGRDGLVYMHACGPGKPDANGNQLELPNKRDENPKTDRLGRATGILSQGAGVTPLDGQTNSDPLWILDMLAAAAKS